MKKVLIANIFGIGDVLFTTPLILSLKKALPGVSVDYLCNARTKDLLDFVPEVDDIHVYEKDDISRAWERSKKQCLADLFRFFSAIRRKRYDAVFDLTFSRKFGFLFALAGIRRRVGFDYKKRGAFLTDRIPLKGFENRHVIEHYLELPGRLGLPSAGKEMRLVPDRTTLERMREYARGRASQGGGLVAVIPGGGASWGAHARRKRWKGEGFSRLADKLSREGFSVGVIGDPSEKALCSRVASGMEMSPAFVENGLSLKDYIALLAGCDLVVCNDGGPLHIAVALGVKSVSVFGPVDEKVYGPYPPSDRHKVVKSDIPCRPCYGRFKLPDCENDMECLDGIDANSVFKACAELLNGTGGKNVRTGP